jgi:hypothetical protein
LSSSFVETRYQSLDQHAGKIELRRENVKILKGSTGSQEFFTIEEHITFAATVCPEVELEKYGFAMVLPMQVERVKGVLRPLERSYQGRYFTIGQDAEDLRRVLGNDIYILLVVKSL